MKTKRPAICMLLCAVFLLTGCIRIIHEGLPSGNPPAGSGTSSDGSGTSSTDSGVSATQNDVPEEPPADDRNEAAAGASTTQLTTTEEEAELSYGLTLSEESYEDIGTLVANRFFAVKQEGLWGVIDAKGEELFPPEYDFYETDGRNYFSLTKSADGAYDAQLYYLADGASDPVEIFTNEAYPALDITAIYPPHLTLSGREAHASSVTIIEMDRVSNDTFDFLRLSQMTRETLLLNGFDEQAWGGMSDYFVSMTSDGGSFISYSDWQQDDGLCYNMIGIDGLNQLVFSDMERSRTMQILPYAPNEEGWYAGYVINTSDNTSRLSYGNIETADFASGLMRSFPADAKEIVPDESIFCARPGRGDRIVLKDGNGKLAVFNMKAEKADTGFDFTEILLADGIDFPHVVSDGEKAGYLAAGAKETDLGFDSAALYDEAYGVALVCKDGKLYAIDEDGNRVSEETEDWEDASVRYLYGNDSHAFAVEKDGTVYLCTVEGL